MVEAILIGALQGETRENLYKADGWTSESFLDTQDLLARLDDSDDEDVRFILKSRARYNQDTRDQLRALVLVPRPYTPGYRPNPGHRIL